MIKSLQCFIHAEVSKMKMYIDKGCFYNYEEHNNEYEEVIVFGISCQEDKYPKFEIITNEGFVFSDIPSDKLFFKIPPNNNKIIHNCYNKCLSNDFTICEFNHLKKLIANVYFF